MIGFLNPSSLCTVASLWPRRWLRIGLVFVDTAISSSSFDEVPRHFSRCRPVVALEQTKLLFGHALGQTGFTAGMGVLDQFESTDLIVCSNRSQVISANKGLQPKRGRLKILMDYQFNLLTKGGGERRGVGFAPRALFHFMWPLRAFAWGVILHGAAGSDHKNAQPSGSARVTRVSPLVTQHLSPSTMEITCNPSFGTVHLKSNMACSKGQ